VSAKTGVAIEIASRKQAMEYFISWPIAYRRINKLQ
jgi:hypothetical protein